MTTPWQGLGASVKYLVKTYLDDSHYNKLHLSLSEKWDRTACELRAASDPFGWQQVCAVTMD
eukprot:5692945-Amphidinium_carterae.1